MLLFDWVLNNWYWAAGGYALAFGACTYYYARGYIRAQRDYSAAVNSGTGTDDYRDDFDYTADAKPRHRISDAERRSVWGPDGRVGPGGHVADSDSVRTVEKAVA